MNIKLSKKDLEVIDFLVRGYSMAQIAELTFRSPRTIESRVNLLKSKIGAHKKSELIGWVIDNLYQMRMCA